jgi:hypothetical protein
MHPGFLVLAGRTEDAAEEPEGVEGNVEVAALAEVEDEGKPRQPPPGLQVW